jgi:hypothetical protein
MLHKTSMDKAVASMEESAGSTEENVGSERRDKKEGARWKDSGEWEERNKVDRVGGPCRSPVARWDRPIEGMACRQANAGVANGGSKRYDRNIDRP